jgi:hypothetical protein
VPTLSTYCQSNKARKEIKRIQIDKEVGRLSLFADDMILYLKDPKNSSQNS